jgi:hypothetical protein
MRKTILCACALAALAAATLAAEPGEREKRGLIVSMAESFKGVAYMYGSESPSAFDCSGFVHYVYSKALDIDLPRNSRGQFVGGSPVKLATARAGDVLVFDTVGGAPSHVGIFVGDGMMIHAASEGPETGIIVSSLQDPYYSAHFIGARSYLAPAVKAALPTKAETAKLSPLAEIGFTVASKPSVVADKIPAVAGTAMVFSITNGTGKDGTFRAVLCKTDLDSKKTRILREDRALIMAGASCELPSYVFAEPGVYTLDVKDSDDVRLMRRTWQVVGRSARP